MDGAFHDNCFHSSTKSIDRVGEINVKVKLCVFRSCLWNVDVFHFIDFVNGVECERHTER